MRGDLRASEKDRERERGRERERYRQTDGQNRVGERSEGIMR